MALEVATRGMFDRNLVLDDAGIRRGRALIGWDDIDHYRYDCHDWTRPGDLVLVTRAGRVVRVAPIFDQWQVVAERVLGELHPRLVRRPYFDPFALDGDALVHRTLGRLPLADIVHLELASIGPALIVDVHARAGLWCEIDASIVANLWLWLD